LDVREELSEVCTTKHVQLTLARVSTMCPAVVEAHRFAMEASRS